MKIKDKDFVWLCDIAEGTIDWGYVMDGRIILQNSGFEDLADFDEFGIYKDYDDYFIGGFVRNATSFASARAFYEHCLSGDDRFFDHNTQMVAMGMSKWAEGWYVACRQLPREMTLGRLSDIFGQKIEIG